MATGENTQFWGNYYQGGDSVASAATNSNPANNPLTNPAGTTSDGTDIKKAGQVAASGNSFGWWVGLVVLFIVLTFAVEKFDSGSTFGNVKLSAYNMLLIGLNAVLFIALGKYFFTKFPVPGLATLFLNA